MCPVINFHYVSFKCMLDIMHGQRQSASWNAQLVHFGTTPPFKPCPQHIYIYIYIYSIMYLKQHSWSLDMLRVLSA